MQTADIAALAANIGVFATVTGTLALLAAAATLLQPQPAPGRHATNRIDAFGVFLTSAGVLWAIGATAAITFIATS